MMLYRDFMQKYRPLYAPDDGSGAAPTVGAAAPAAVTPADGGAAVPEASTAPAAAAPTTPEAPASTDAPVADASEPTLLESATGKKPDAKAEGDNKDSPAPADAAKPEDGKKPEEGKEPKADDKKADGDKDAAKTDPENKDAPADDQPPAPIKYDAFKVPDGIKLDDKEMEKFTEVAGKAQIPQDVAQNLIDLYVEERKQDAIRAQQHQQDVWKQLNNGWKDELRKHPELGGNRLETTLGRAKAVIEEYLGGEKYGGSPELVQQLMGHVKANGMGNFMPFVRLLNTIGEQLNIFEDTPVSANPQPPRTPRGPGQRGWYDKSNMGNGAKAP
jgi:hypothetical protein